MTSTLKNLFGMFKGYIFVAIFIFLAVFAIEKGLFLWYILLMLVVGLSSVCGIVCCGIGAFILYGGNDLTTFWTVVLFLIGLGIFVFMVLVELVLSLLYALFGIREGLKTLHNDMQHFSDLYVKNALITPKKSRKFK